MKNLPKHIAFIVDGNRRWAKKRGLAQTVGHDRAANVRLEELVYHCLKRKICYVTFWVFSTENWKRGKRFANILFKILKKGLERNIDKFIKDGIRLNTIGDLTKLPKDIVQSLENVKKRSKHNSKLTVTIAINYGGRDEIIRAVKRAVSSIKYQVSKDRLMLRQLNNLTIEQFNNYLDTAGMPDPDMIIRTGGDQRLSGFMLWQAAYAELYFTKVLFPDFGKKELDRALGEFSRRQRRYGK